MNAIPDKQEKCRRIVRLVAGGKGVVESCREVGISEKTFYRWRKSQDAGRQADLHPVQCRFVR
ncbi:hypothetical protein GCM10011371_19810 [Novosphingobium marinum]|uniref:Transposase-like protein n=1 Tax=Novosphingobium marinum TaxID=1514948 RepID=A0A7Z0BUB8_9SPHN|nr:helix-turn-helix domain-containing protein [Novosphingobium marinum]NYH96094.1 transposase-like protein [Novosphingobium marinum]GGC32429.1 hypothetical protein GCM10011371_19810 [Novosphingobium marinum]